MRAAGLAGVHRRRAVHTTVRDRDAAPAPDLVNRTFTAAAPDRLWVADITYVPTWAGFLYVAVVIDASAGSSSAGRFLAEQHDEWLTAERRYLPQASITRVLGGAPLLTLGDLLKEGVAV